jgi:hypothetical protein
MGIVVLLIMINIVQRPNIRIAAVMEGLMQGLKRSVQCARGIKMEPK